MIGFKIKADAAVRKADNVYAFDPSTNLGGFVMLCQDGIHSFDYVISRQPRLLGFYRFYLGLLEKIHLIFCEFYILGGYSDCTKNCATEGLVRIDYKWSVGNANI